MKVVVTRKIPGPAEEMLKAKGYEVVIGTDFAGADAILSLLTDKIDGAVMDAAGRQLKIVANYAVGFDNVDLEAAKQRNVYVTNTPGGFESSVAEHAVMLMLAVSRKLIAADKYVREGKYIRWEPELFLGTELTKKTIGIVGMGRIGSVVARICEAGMEMKIVYCSHGKEGAIDLPELLSVSDVVTLHVPLTPETKHMISKKELSGMKKSAILINTSRGAIVDEAALCEALSSSWIAGAGLDVFEDETPVVSPTEKILHGLSNVVLTPHIGSATIEARSEMSRMAAQNIIAALSGKTPENLAK